MKCYRMWHKAMYLTKTVHESDLGHHLQNGWVILFECTCYGERIVR